MRLLLDENFSWRVSQLIVSATKIHCTSIQEQGMRGSIDQVVFDFCVDRDYVLATRNVDDFKSLIANNKRGFHRGMIFVYNGNGNRQEQYKQLCAAIGFAEGSNLVGGNDWVINVDANCKCW